MTGKLHLVRVNIVGEEYAIRSDAPPEHTRAVAEYVDRGESAKTLDHARERLPDRTDGYGGWCSPRYHKPNATRRSPPRWKLRSRKSFATPAKTMRRPEAALEPQAVTLGLACAPPWAEVSRLRHAEAAAVSAEAPRQASE